MDIQSEVTCYALDNQLLEQIQAVKTKERRISKHVTQCIGTGEIVEKYKISP